MSVSQSETGNANERLHKSNTNSKSMAYLWVQEMRLSCYILCKLCKLFFFSFLKTSLCSFNPGTGWLLFPSTENSDRILRSSSLFCEIALLTPSGLPENYLTCAEMIVCTDMRNALCFLSLYSLNIRCQFAFYKFVWTVSLRLIWNCWESALVTFMCTPISRYVPVCVLGL